LKKKQRREKLDVTRRVDPTIRLTQQNPVANPLTFVFLFKKKKTDLVDPITRSKPETRTLDRAGS
jgi:hypothetical protein